jgi:hypothetical protein
MRPVSKPHSLAILGAVIAALWLAVGAVGAEEPPGFGYQLAHELMSPYCPGRSLAACPSEQAAELRQWILLQEAAGASKEDVIASLHARFGDEILATPPSEGWGLVARALPMAALVLGAGIVFLVLRRMVAARVPGDGGDTGDGRPAAAGSAAADGDLERMVDEELRLSDV